MVSICHTALRLGLSESPAVHCTLVLKSITSDEHVFSIARNMPSAFNTCCDISERGWHALRISIVFDHEIWILIERRSSEGRVWCGIRVRHYPVFGVSRRVPGSTVSVPVMGHGNCRHHRFTMHFSQVLSFSFMSCALTNGDCRWGGSSLTISSFTDFESPRSFWEERFHSFVHSFIHSFIHSFNHSCDYFWDKIVYQLIWFAFHIFVYELIWRGSSR